MSKSLQQFREWATAVKRTGNPAGGSYSGQCVSLVQQYLDQVFSVPYTARGNAKDFVPPTFNRVSGAVQAGDIIRYGANYGYGYGHIGIIDDNGQFLDQNGVLALHVGIRATPFNGIEGVYRPTKGFNVKTPAPAPTAGGRIAVPAKTARVTALGLNVRRESSTSSPILATYSQGQTFMYDSYIIANGYVWLSYVGASGNRAYVAEGVRR